MVSFCIPTKVKAAYPEVSPLVELQQPINEEDITESEASWSNEQERDRLAAQKVQQVQQEQREQLPVMDQNIQDILHRQVQAEEVIEEIAKAVNEQRSWFQIMLQQQTAPNRGNRPCPPGDSPTSVQQNANGGALFAPSSFPNSYAVYNDSNGETAYDRSVIADIQTLDPAYSSMFAIQRQS